MTNPTVREHVAISSADPMTDRVAVDTEELITHVLDDLNLKVVDPPRIEVTKARVEAKGDVFAAMQMSGAKSVATLTGRFPLPNVAEQIMELLTHTAATPVRLTRRTIVSGVKNQQAILDNPNIFATVAANVIREKFEEQLVLDTFAAVAYSPRQAFQLDRNTTYCPNSHRKITGRSWLRKQRRTFSA